MATTQTLRNELFNSMKALKEGKISIKEAQVTAKIAANIIYASRLDLENKRMNIKLSRSVPVKAIPM